MARGDRAEAADLLACLASQPRLQDVAYLGEGFYISSWIVLHIWGPDAVALARSTWDEVNRPDDVGDDLNAQEHYAEVEARLRETR